MWLAAAMPARKPRRKPGDWETFFFAAFLFRGLVAALGLVLRGALRPRRAGFFLRPLRGARSFLAKRSSCFMRRGFSDGRKETAEEFPPTEHAQDRRDDGPKTTPRERRVERGPPIRRRGAG